MPEGALVAVLEGHTSWVSCCAFSPDSTMLATVGWDSTIRLCSVAHGRCVCALRLASPLNWVAWHPSGNLLGAVGGAGVYLLTYLPQMEHLGHR
jgi:COMPASS component SWD3